jgi:CBS domain-containing protein
LRIGDFTGDTVVAGEHESLADAASRMRYDGAGCVAVLKGARLVGVLSERDITRAMADGADGDDALVGEYMTPDPAAVLCDLSAVDAAQTMLDSGLTHMPVVNERGFLGMASLLEVLSELFVLDFEQRQRAVRAVRG